MNTTILAQPTQLGTNRLNFLLPASPRFAQRFAGTHAARRRLAQPDFERLFDSTLLDRLQAPLTRRHE
ncbi:MAG TPA: hypothetical protein VL200_13710 [Lacunisphaera sp.]|jgi:hypothetical protein|nr:hypothetical protein [Lacunisphaera sp.]